MSRAISLTSQTSHKQRQCDVLGELFRGPSGVVSVGRMLRGTELGRLVFLRQVSEQHLAQVRATVDMARCVAHPSLLKVVGRVETPQTTFIASEYISGVSLMELLENAMSRGQRIDTDIAVRIVRDALLAAARAKALLLENTGSLVSRCIFPDTIWLAEFGETMLTEVGIAESLVEDYREKTADAAGNEDEIDDDVAAAGAELLKLLTNQPLEEAEMTLPLSGDLASIVARAVNPGASNRFTTAQEMADALSALPQSQIASERSVGNTVKKLMASVLAVRHPRRLMSVASPHRPGGEDATSVFQGSFDFSPPRKSALGDSPSGDSGLGNSALEAAPDFEVKSPPNPSPDPVQKHDSGVDPSHPAYAFLAKHGLLEQAGSVPAQKGDEHVAEREATQPPTDDCDDEPTRIASTSPVSAPAGRMPGEPPSAWQARASSNAPHTAEREAFNSPRQWLVVSLLAIAAALSLWLIFSALR